VSNVYWSGLADQEREIDRVYLASRVGRWPNVGLGREEGRWRRIPNPGATAWCIGHDIIAAIVRPQGENSGGGLLPDRNAIGFGRAVGDLRQRHGILGIQVRLLRGKERHQGIVASGSSGRLGRSGCGHRWGDCIGLEGSAGDGVNGVTDRGMDDR
jgi:hypothetical protein